MALCLASTLASPGVTSFMDCATRCTSLATLRTSMAMSLPLCPDSTTTTTSPRNGSGVLYEWLCICLPLHASMPWMLGTLGCE